MVGLWSVPQVSSPGWQAAAGVCSRSEWPALQRVEHWKGDLNGPEGLALEEVPGCGLSPVPEPASPPLGALAGGPHVPGKAQGDCTAGAAAATAGAGATAAPGEAGARTAAPSDSGEEEAPGRGCVGCSWGSHTQHWCLRVPQGRPRASTVIMQTFLVSKCLTYIIT